MSLQCESFTVKIQPKTKIKKIKVAGIKTLKCDWTKNNLK